jgi:HSP20 family protein
MYAASLRFPNDFFADFEELTRQFDAAFGGRDGSSSIRSTGRGAFPAINMGSNADAVEVYAFAPGIDAGKLEVTVDKGLLTIAGERKPTATTADNRQVVYARERANGSFRRVISLPEDVDAERVTARYQDGVLHVSIPKREASKPRRIQVR